MRRNLIPFAIAIAFVSFGLSASAVIEETDTAYIVDLAGEETINALAEEFKQREAEIKAELAEVGSVADWTGEYYFGDGLGVNVSLVIAPGRGFAAYSSGCVGIYGRSYGSVSQRNGRLVLDHETTKRLGALDNFSKVLVPVRWGERLYLVGEEQMGDFINFVNSGREMCSGYCPTRFLLRRGEEELKVSGKPELPAEYVARLLDEPLFSMVTKIVKPDREVVDGDYHWREATIELDVGRNHGIWQGMEFHSTTAGAITDTITVVEVNDTTAVAEVSSYDTQQINLRAGTCLSTYYDDALEKRVDGRPQSGCDGRVVALR